jgi:transposase-like protein
MEKLGCPECGSSRLVKFGCHVWIRRELKQQYRCKDCGRLTVYPVIVNENKLATKPI